MNEYVPSCRDWRHRLDSDFRQNLPKPGERLVFGVHRLLCEERECKAWPHQITAGQTRYRNWIKGAAKDPAYIRFRVAQANAKAQQEQDWQKAQQTFRVAMRGPDGTTVAAL